MKHAAIVAAGPKASEWLVRLRRLGLEGKLVMSASLPAGMILFAHNDRKDAGRRLAKELVRFKDQHPVVLVRRAMKRAGASVDDQEVNFGPIRS